MGKKIFLEQRRQKVLLSRKSLFSRYWLV